MKQEHKRMEKFDIFPENAHFFKHFFLVGQLTNGKKIFLLALFYRNIGRKWTFDIVEP